jgi:TonB-linked SusC/RagA family outer membrane protein
VVVGYGTQRKKDVTGAISSVSAKQIQERQAVDVLDALQGQAPGLQIAQESGRPGAGASVRIRGIGTFQGGVDPLYIVDGAQGVSIDGINPNDIESIQILKDAASAAIYGSRSANGVVIITTKKGREGKPTLDLRYLSAISKLSHKIPQANATERRLLDFKRGGSAGLNTDSVNPSINADNDYQDELTRTALRQQVDLSLGGASSNINYYGSLGYLKDEGIILNSWANILRGRFNVDYHPTSKITYGNRVQFSYQTENRINEGNTLNQAIQRPPNFRIYLPDGTLAGNLGGRKNPVAEALLRTNKYDILDGSFYNYISYNFLPELKLTVDANVNINYTHNVLFEPNLLSNTGKNNDGNDEQDWKTYWMLQSYLNYNKTFGGVHTITGVLGVSADRNFSRNAQINGINYATESVITLNAAQVYDLPANGEQRYTSASAFGRIGYSYKGKYLFNSNFRADGSSKFGKDNRWGYFPSASVGWRFSEEPFMKWAYNYLDDGKLRASWGLTGNDRIGSYDAIMQYTFGDNYYDGVSGIAPSSTFGNNNLSWEQTKQINVGMDLSFFRGRLTVTADYYDKTTSKLLYQAPLASETGFDNVNVNIGSIQNKGLEFLVSGYPVRNNNFSWNVAYNMSFNNAIIKELYGNIPIASSIWKSEVGDRIGNFYGWKALGVYQYDQSNAYTDDWEQLTPAFDNSGAFAGYTLNGKAYTGNVNKLKTQGNVLKGGDMIWQNTNKDSVIDDNDRILLGNAQPKWIAGLSNMINYKNFSLSFNIYVSWGGMIYDRGRQQLNTNATTNVTPDPEYIRNAWWHQGDVTIWPIAKNNGMGNARELSSLYLEDASFIRLRNVRLTYSLPKNVASKVKLNGASIYLYGNNLLTWTNYFWYDPEISFSNPLEMGRDNGRYPRKREIGAGINLNF